MLSKEQYQVYQDRVEMSDSEYEMICVPTRDLRELLSLREQLAELKALPAIGKVVLGDYDSDGTRPSRVVCLHDQADWDNFQDGTLLFTAAKPAAGLGVEDITEFMRKAFWRGFESARGTENSNIPADWKDSKPNLLLALKAKISGD